jgi:hypothetical protein
LWGDGWPGYCKQREIVETKASYWQLREEIETLLGLGFGYTGGESWSEEEVGNY